MGQWDLCGGEGLGVDNGRDELLRAFCPSVGSKISLLFQDNLR